MNSPLISIVTVVYNSASTIESTILSVVNQSYVNIQYIVIDGASEDGTTDIIKKYENYISYWISESDGGIYDAMNKGINQAVGDYTIFLNSGDYIYSSDTVGKIANYISSLQGVDMIYGRSKIINKKGDLGDLIVRHPLNELWKGPVFRHGALLCRTELLKENKFEISEELKIAADFEFIYKIYKKGYNFQAIDVVILAFREEGISDNPYKHIQDCSFILRKHNDWDVKKKLYYQYRFVRLVMSRSILKLIYKGFRAFFQNYFSNYWINSIPFYFIRHQYYKRIMGVKIGKGSSIHLNCFLYGTNITIAENTTINRKCYLDGRGTLRIGSCVSISPEVHLITEDHDYNSPDFTGRSRDVIIEDYVWIGTRATILPGVHIGKGAVVCAGAVVTKNVNEFDVVAGIPAVKIKERNRNLNYNPSWFAYFD